MSDSISTHRKNMLIFYPNFSYIAAIIISLDNIQDGRLDFIEQNSFGQPVFAIINKDKVIPTNIINRLTGVIDLNKRIPDRIQPRLFPDWPIISDHKAVSRLHPLPAETPALFSARQIPAVPLFSQPTALLIWPGLNAQCRQRIQAEETEYRATLSSALQNGHTLRTQSPFLRLILQMTESDS